ncbi:tRNA uracil 4-sulfurtransferase ThiI [Jeotgalibaca porci]|jgi:thiamine biosynthesis protein ThiI|uniref:Probable tRNA sulfurtransferase n=1 Tax=Jeotgalibaca porci TaxID=1868793 RepID=A0A6G7WFH9_9LACT|nr:tRNA uracil 4-sulfurtransferase ThiI [Jeotgalibaca porci]NLB98931.1 tRNA 4-thiouridine(8) synthase ThiI [Lactobacillales bacterium]QIK51045.1 tRNA 4-thiouridine(8) synthase ThiI [Jeotgalibaca porci]
METRIQIRFGELSTKGKNKKRFIQQLSRNIREATQDYPQIKIQPNHDFIFLDLNDADEAVITSRLKDIFGIQNFSPVYVIPRDYETARAAVVELMQGLETEGKTFKIATRRSDHSYEHDTNWLNAEFGAAVLQNIPNITVQVKKPDITVRVDVKKEHFLISTETYQGAGGLPVGSSGRGVLMLSGGIDSPVAGYLAMKRGVEIEAVHFHSPPYTSPQALKKAKDLTAKITRFGGQIQFIEVPFTEIQEEIKAKIPEGYAMTITRRMMLRITDAVREKRKALAIFNGESLGQVASQTLESMIAINAVTTTPIIRPVATMDKNEIIDIAQKIDTFDLSIQPFEDCCTIFAPAAPKTKPQIDRAERYEEQLDIVGLVERAVEGMIVTPITSATAIEEETIFSDLL